MKLIVGLGNPGEKYLGTRHNIGFMVIDRLAQQMEIRCNQKKYQSLFCKKLVGHEEIILLKPQTFMNLSGIAVKQAVEAYRCPLQDIMVVCDDIDLPTGKVRIRRKGGSGGHRGLKSIADLLGTQEFPRLRIGIGRSSVKGPKEHVLSVFSMEEESLIRETIERSTQALKTWIFEGIESCMKKFN